MSSKTDIDVLIPGIMADFVGTRGKNGFDEVIQDFSNAEEVRILTYSRIGSYRFHSKLSLLKNLAPGTKLRIIVALPGIKNEKQKNGEYDYDQYTVDSVLVQAMIKLVPLKILFMNCVRCPLDIIFKR